ncbi:uncharacterized protein DS421_14g475080 [Arachis hypogaea]|nr:uncharacterized protein DS421_14g475080 [Arachis hypogaea]
MAGGLMNLARLKAAITQEEGEGLLSTPQSRPQADSRTVSQDLVSVREGCVASPGPAAVEVEDEVVVVLPKAARKWRRTTEGSSRENVEEEGWCLM